jgi:hypothetical protein
MLRWLVVIFALLAPVPALAQGAVEQGGTWTQGHAPMYVGNGSFGNAVIQDSGPAGGGGVGIGMSEGLYVAQGTGAAPFSGQGTGPLGTNVCDYDAPITNPTGFHYLCFSPNILGNFGAIVYGNNGLATAQPLVFNVDGVQQFSLSAAGINFTAPILFNGLLPVGGGAQTLCESAAGVLSFNCASGGGGGTPGGTTLSVQYNNAGSFAGVTVLANGFLITNAGGTPILGTQGNLTTAPSLAGATMPVFVSGGAIDQATVGNVVAGTGISITGTSTVTIALNGTLSGTGSVFATSTGTLTPTHCVSIDSNGNFVDAGGACTTGGGGGTVSAGTANQLAFYASSGTTVGGLATANNGVLVTSGAGVPSIGSTLPSALTLPSPTMTGTATVAAASFSGFAQFNLAGTAAGIFNTNTGAGNRFQVDNSGTRSNASTQSQFIATLTSGGCGNCDIQLDANGGASPAGFIFVDAGLTGGLTIQTLAGGITLFPATNVTITGTAPQINSLLNCVGIQTNGSGLTSCATAVAGTYINVTLNGIATGNSAATNTTALNALIASASGCLYFPAGVYQVTTLTSTAAVVCMIGDAPQKSVIQTTASTGDVFTFTNMYYIHDIGFSFSSAGHRTSGAYIHAQSGGNLETRLQDVWFNGCFWCIDTTDNVLTYDNLYFEMTVATAVAGEMFVRIHGCAGACRLSHLMNPAFSGTFPQAGVFVDGNTGGTTFQLTDSDFLSCQHGLQIATTGSNIVNGFVVQGNFFDTGTADAILLQATGTSSILAGKFVNNWSSSASAGGSGIHLVTASGTTISNIDFVNQQSTNNAADGALVDASAGGTISNIGFIGGQYNNNSASGILALTVTNLRIEGVGANGNTTAGVSVNNGSHAIITGNILTGNGTDVFSNAAAPSIEANNVCTSATC